MFHLINHIPEPYFRKKGTGLKWNKITWLLLPEKADLDTFKYINIRPP